ncbi:MAG: TauD/TfdA family dioxygenase [Rhodospirillaceae bacterium]|nr:TauD/TfdA family dioxygenase [Rhodospirillaceae bacterium]
MVRKQVDGEDFAVTVEPGEMVDDPVAWCISNQSEIEELADTYPAILLRGLGVRDEVIFQRIRDVVVGEPSAYVYRSTPRTELGDGVMTATEYPASEHILLHCENAYQRDWPLRLAFCCLNPPTTGGQTPIADVRAVTRAIGEDTLDLFERRGVRYVRNYHEGFDLDWRVVFQTEDPAAVAAYCTEHDIEFTWLPDGRLRTSQICQAVARHPGTGERVWFNQAHLFHPSALGPDVQQDLLDIFGEEELPRNACFGDGAAIDAALLESVRQAFADAAHVFDWQAGDVMILDNMLAAHGRRPFTGPRQVLVSMGRMMSEWRTDNDNDNE